MFFISVLLEPLRLWAPRLLFVGLHAKVVCLIYTHLALEYQCSLVLESWKEF